ncbi:MAG: hypothetical protein ACJAZB_000468 [Psychrosphaera sp.]|jgi:uncharacterized protein with NRDE domain
MCSFNWQKIDGNIVAFFNRDESVIREKAEEPCIFNDGKGQFIMAKDPQGQGSWISCNEYGLTFFLLNNYQGKLKANTAKLRSRGLLIRDLASCSTQLEALSYIEKLNLNQYQPFNLVMLTNQTQLMWLYDGLISKLDARPAEHSIFSSGHKHAEDIIKQRHSYMQQFNDLSETELIAIHKSHEPMLGSTSNEKSEDKQEKDLSYAFCMHREDACSQSMTKVVLREKDVRLDYWQGQPCQSEEKPTVSVSLLLI